MTIVPWLIALAATFVVAYYTGFATAAILGMRRINEAEARAQHNPGSAE